MAAARIHTSLHSHINLTDITGARNVQAGTVDTGDDRLDAFDAESNCMDSRTSPVDPPRVVAVFALTTARILNAARATSLLESSHCRGDGYTLTLPVNCDYPWP